MFENLIDDKFVNYADRIAVGVSGGADSMLLLWAIIDKQKQKGFYFEVINVNHHLRGAESDGDSLFVKKFCEKRKIPYRIIDVNVKELKNDKKYTLEESARIARYDAFKKVMKQDGLTKLFLAHHKNDQAETILMHIFRGSGISGAIGIKNTDYIFRPLLNLTKNEILKIAKEHSIEFVQDSTNFDNDYSRNFIRNVVIPQIEQVYPTVVENIAAFGKKCEEVQNYILSQIDENLLEKNKDFVNLSQKIFETERFVGREYLKIAFENLSVFSDIEAKHIAMIYELSKADVNKEVCLPHELVARKTYNGVRIFKQKKDKNDKFEFEFSKNSEIVFGDFCKIVTKVVSCDDVEYGNALYVDSSKISKDAVWRTRRIGDKFSRIGTGSKKLNDYLTNSKLDFDLRDKIPLLAVGDSVLVLYGEDISEKVKIDANTDEIIRITFEII